MDWEDCSTGEHLVEIRDITAVPPFEDGVTSLVTFLAGAIADRATAVKFLCCPRSLRTLTSASVRACRPI